MADRVSSRVIGLMIVAGAIASIILISLVASGVFTSEETPYERGLRRGCEQSRMIYGFDREWVEECVERGSR